MTLWTSPAPSDPAALAFTRGRDQELDGMLLPFDCTASMAHAQSLEAMGMLTGEECQRLCETLKILRTSAQAGHLHPAPHEEDGHECLENHLTTRLGELGHKIHAYRSRNDQVWTALLLFIRHHLKKLRKRMGALDKALQDLSLRWGDTPLPGFTHTRKAMPTTIGAWVGLYRSGLADASHLTAFVAHAINRSPLGTGAGFGFTDGPDREATARRLGFREALSEPLYAQASRSLHSIWVLQALLTLFWVTNRLASDLIVLSMPEFGFFLLPDAFLQGSSLMPHKRNPDVLETIRAQYSILMAQLHQVQTLGMNLIHGYHRDLQSTKAPVMDALLMGLETTAVLTRFLSDLKVDPAACERALTQELQSTRQALELARMGLPFRQAHARVARSQWTGGEA